MKKIFVGIAFGLSLGTAYAQNGRPLHEVYFSAPDKMLEDEEGGYHFEVPQGTVYMSDEGYYSLKDKTGRLIEEGDTEEEDDKFLRDGYWKEYSNGQLQAEGTYWRGRPLGNWKIYDGAGKLQVQYQVIAIESPEGNREYCKAGEETEFYADGRVKQRRFFEAVPIKQEDKVKVKDPETDEEVISVSTVTRYKAVPCGVWLSYNKEGEIEKREQKR